MSLAHHLHVSAKDIGGYVLLPGDPGRCETIASYFEDSHFVASNREFTTYTGTVAGEKVSVTSTGGGCGTCSAGNTLCPISGWIRCSAAIKYDKKRAGSLSPSSSDSQAAGRWLWVIHSLTSVVLPKPAAADTRTSLRCAPSFSRSIGRGRSTCFDRRGGMCSLVVRMDIRAFAGGRSAPSAPTANIIR